MLHPPTAPAATQPGLCPGPPRRAVRAGIRGKLGTHGVLPAQIPRLVEVALADVCHQTNPRPCTAADFQRLFEDAF